MEQNYEEKNTVNPASPETNKKVSKKKIFSLILVLIVLIALLFIWYSGKKYNTSNEEPSSLSTSSVSEGENNVEEMNSTTSQIEEDNTSSINNDLESIDVKNLNEEFQSLDSDLENLQ